MGLVTAPGASIPNGGGTNAGLPNTPAHVAKQISVALIDDGNVQLDQLSRELSTGLELLSMKPTITHFTNVAEYLEKRSDGFTQCDAIVVGYSNPDMNEFVQQITRLQKESQPKCKICALSSNPLEKAERTCLNGLSIRFFPKDRSACGKILNMLSSPDLRKCSSCTRWKPMTEFSGKATCDACRPKKRKQCAGAAIDKRAAIDMLVNQHERLRETVEKQNNELLLLRNQVSARARALLAKRGLKEETCKLDPIPQPLHQVPPTGLYSNIVQPVVQQPNMQQPIVDKFAIPQQLAVLPLQPQEIRDPNQAKVPKLNSSPQPLHQVPPTGLYSNIVQPVVQQPNMQQPIVDKFAIPQQLAVLPLQPQEIRDANQAKVPKLNSSPQPLHQVPPTGLYSNIIQPVVQQPNMQQPIVDKFAIPQQLAVLPLQPQEVRDANQAEVPNAFGGDQALQNFAFLSEQQQEQQQLLQQQQQQQHQLLLQQQQQQLLLHHQQLLQGQGNVFIGGHVQPNTALSLLPQINTQQQPMRNTLPMTMQHQQVMDGNATSVVNMSPGDQTLHTYTNSFQSPQQQPQQTMIGSSAAMNIGPGDQAQLDDPLQGLNLTYNHPAPMEQQHQQGTNGNLIPRMNDDAAQNLQMYMNTR